MILEPEYQAPEYQAPEYQVPDELPHGGDREKRMGIVLPAAAVASAAVAVVSLVSYLVSPNGSGADSLAKAINALPKARSITLLEQERQQIIVMNQAASTMAVAAKPAVVHPADIQAVMPQPKAAPATTSSSSQGSSTSSSSQGSSTSGTTTTTSTASQGSGFEPTPSEAKVLAQQIMPSFGFSVSSQWTCLDEIWTQESSWMWDAENPSGAYGIPQSLPASKMASVASDYRTNATTQIKWGLGYIQSVYGTPCAAWNHEVADGFY
jgi:hypothetical protein